MARSRAGILSLFTALALSAGTISGCGGGSGSSNSALARERAALTSYLAAIEPLRLAVNRLLEGADPILSGAHSGALSPQLAARRMGALERRFAAYAVDVNAIAPTAARLRGLQAIYAHTYILEDSYLSALVVGLGERDFDDLPDTQAEQRAAIIQWRVGLEVLARHLGTALPADLQAAGRGEIAPSPDGS
jgi:hypothetical protein